MQSVAISLQFFSD